jgi:hypothetical protein
MYNLAKIVTASSILSGVPAHAVTEINYWLWDNNQRPSYEACAAAFEEQNPMRSSSMAPTPRQN